MARNPIVPTIPLDAPGKHHGFLRLPHSRDDSAWGSVMIPLTVVANGDGPTALLIAGNHGDEYEGPLALTALATELDPAEVTGRVIVLPTLNLPAVLAGTRVSPIDGVNLNRAFPGRPDGTVTQKIAHYVAHHLVPDAAIVLDLHSGGKTLDFLPLAASHVLPDKAQEAACHAAARAFGAPYTLTMLEIDAVGLLDTAAEGQGKVFVTTELGGGGSASARSIAIARRGVANVLRHAGVLPAGQETAPDTAAGRAPTALLDMPDADCFVFSEDGGLFEPVVDLGAMVARGDILARIWRADRTGLPPRAYRANRAGILTARHVPGLAKPGDCLAVVADVVAEQDLKPAPRLT